MSTDDIVS